MVRFFAGVTIVTLAILSLACGGTPTVSNAPSSTSSPNNSAAVDREQATPATTSSPSPAAERLDPFAPLVVDWIRNGRPALAYAVGQLGGVPALEVVTVVDANTAVCLVGDSDQVVIVDELQTAGLVGGQTIGLELARVRGTQPIEDGEAFVLVPMDTTAAKQAILQDAEQRAAIEAEQADALTESQFREWRSAEGDFSVTARLDQYVAGVVTLEREDGGSVEVPEEKLSEDDRQYITEEFKRRRKAARAANRAKS